MTKKELAEGLRQIARKKGYSNRVIKHTFPTDSSIILNTVTCINCGEMVIDARALPELIAAAKSAVEFRKLVDRYKMSSCN